MPSQFLLFCTTLTCCCSLCHQNVLSNYPPNQILSTLQYLASREQKELEEKLASLDVTRDVTALQYGPIDFLLLLCVGNDSQLSNLTVFIWHVNCRFRYESDHLLDISTEEDDELPPVKILLQVLHKTHVY